MLIADLSPDWTRAQCYEPSTFTSFPHLGSSMSDASEVDLQNLCPIVVIREQHFTTKCVRPVSQMA